MPPAIIYRFGLTNSIEMEIAILIRKFGTIKKFQFLHAGGTNGISLRKQSALYGRYGPLRTRGRENHSKLSFVASFNIVSIVPGSRI